MMFIRNPLRCSLLFVLFLLFSTLLSSCSPNRGPLPVSSWTYVTGDNVTGINQHSLINNLQAYPQTTLFNGKLYGIWSLTSTLLPQIRVAVYNGNDTVPAWQFVDGNGGTGINHNSQNLANYPQIAVSGSKLYATWLEDSSVSTLRQVRIAVYNGDDKTPAWQFVDGDGSIGINHVSTNPAYVPQLTEFQSKLYATWFEFSGGVSGNIRVAVYNGNDAAPSWQFVDGNSAGGINKDATQVAMNPQITSTGSNLYAIWEERSSTTLVPQIRVAVYNGNDLSPAWSFVDGNGTTGINKNNSSAASEPQLTYFASKLYATWTEDNGTTPEIRVAVYNGNDGAPAWSIIDGNGPIGLNWAQSSASSPQLTALGPFLYATWSELGQSTGVAGYTLKTRVAVYNGNDADPGWMFVDGNTSSGLNSSVFVYAANPQLTALNSTLYAIWSEGEKLIVAAGQ